MSSSTLFPCFLLCWCDDIQTVSHSAMVNIISLPKLCHWPQQPVHGDNLPDPKRPLSATTEANTQVQEAANVKASKKRGSYGRFHVRKRAAVGTYACMNRVVAAARYYPRIIKYPVNKTAFSHCCAILSYSSSCPLRPSSISATAPWNTVATVCYMASCH